MTEEEMQALIEEQEKQISDLTAERDSLKEEQTAQAGKIKDLEKDLADTKKMNFTLSRRLDAAPANVGDIMHKMFSRNN